MKSWRRCGDIFFEDILEQHLNSTSPLNDTIYTYVGKSSQGSLFFLNIFNQRHLNIQLTIENEAKQPVPVLDVTLRRRTASSITVSNQIRDWSVLKYGCFIVAVFAFTNHLKYKSYSIVLPLSQNMVTESSKH